MDSPKSKNTLNAADKQKLELIYSLVSEFANRNVTRYSLQELQLITMFFRRYSVIRDMMEVLQNAKSETTLVFIDYIKSDFKFFKALKQNQRKLLNDFGLKEVKSEIENFIKTLNPKTND